MRKTAAFGDSDESKNHSMMRDPNSYLSSKMNSPIESEAEDEEELKVEAKDDKAKAF